MGISKFFDKKRGLRDQSNNGKVDNKRTHRLGNPNKIEINLDQSLLNICGTILDGGFFKTKINLKTLEYPLQKI